MAVADWMGEGQKARSRNRRLCNVWLRDNEGLSLGVGHVSQESGMKVKHVEIELKEHDKRLDMGSEGE